MPRHLSGLVLGLTLVSSACRALPQSPFVEAAAVGRLDEISRLLADGQDPNQRDRAGTTVLALAARGGHVRVIEQLAQAGADLNRRDANENQWTPLLHAIETGQQDAVRALLRLGARASSDSEYGVTPLSLAAGHGLTDVVGWLLDAGADPYATQKNGENALSAAVGGGTGIEGWPLGTCHTDTVRLLLARAPDLRMPRTVFGSLSLWAARIGHCDEVLDLVDPRPRRAARP